MKRVVPLILTVIPILALGAAAAVYVALGNQQRQLNNEISGLEIVLKTGAEKYTRCYYSVHNSGYLVDRVSSDYLPWNYTDAEKAQYDQARSDFKTNVRKQCNDTIANYERMYAEYEGKVEEASGSGLITFLTGGMPIDSDKVDTLDTLRFMTGDALSYFIFTKEDVERYFDQKLAND